MQLPVTLIRKSKAKSSPRKIRDAHTKEPQNDNIIYYSSKNVNKEFQIIVSSDSNDFEIYI